MYSGKDDFTEAENAVIDGHRKHRELIESNNGGGSSSGL
jgi:hypothetical protein